MKPKHCSFLEHEEFNLEFWDLCCGREVSLTIEIQHNSNIIYSLNFSDFWSEQRIPLYETDIFWMAKDLLSLYWYFYQIGGQITTCTLTLNEQELEVEIPVWAMEKVIWLLYNKSKKLGVTTEIDARYLTNKQGYR